jgi:hypothetical protein
MIVWRIVSSRIYGGRTITASNTIETEFYANPEKFCNFNVTGTHQLFTMRFNYWDEPACLVEIETAEVIL